MALIEWRSRADRKLRIVPLGDSALLAEFATEVDLEANARIQRIAAAIKTRSPQWVRDVVPAVGALAVHFDPSAGPSPHDAREQVRALIEACLAAGRGRAGGTDPEVVDLPICYGGEFGADLEAVAQHAGLAPDEVVRRHAASDHRVLMVGFVPGHPYIGGLDASLAMPRRATPRARVPEGSVGIANAQTAIYPYAISGGWNLIGRTPVRLFDAEREPPALFAPGQRVRVRPIDRAEFARMRASRDEGA